MSKIDELIAKYCPAGIEINELGNVCTFQRGRTITQKDAVKGDVPVIAGGQKPSYYHNASNRIGETISVSSSGAYAGFVNYWTSPVFLSDSFSVNPNIELLLPKFVFYFLKYNQEKIHSTKKGSGVPHVQGSSISKFQIPIPPIEIQNEIVKILDNFTELEAELEAELLARMRQYTYYRNHLLSFAGQDVEWKTLDEVGQFVRGKRFVKTDMIAEGFPCIHYGEMYTHYHVWAKQSKSFVRPELASKLRVANPGDVIIVAAGETIEDIGKGTAWLGDTDVVIHDACFSFKSTLNPKYVSYFLRTSLFHDQIKRNISSGKISAINASGLSKARIPVPSIAEQERIVAILDKFDILVNDISQGLPAEIKARRQQYEHYRAKLLSFNSIK